MSIKLISKQLYQLPFTPQQSTIDGVMKKVNTVTECFFVGEVLGIDFYPLYHRVETTLSAAASRLEFPLAEKLNLATAFVLGTDSCNRLSRTNVPTLCTHRPSLIPIEHFSDLRLELIYKVLYAGSTTHVYTKR